MIYLLVALSLLSGLACARDEAGIVEPASGSPLMGRPQPSIFILHSYSQEYPWTRGQHQGFINTLSADPDRSYEVFAEYLDTKRVSLSPSYAALMTGYLSSKYADHRPSAIYVTDDNALSFALDNMEDIFPGVPLFLSGVNDYSVKEQLPAGRFSGVFEKKEIAPNLALMQQFDQVRSDIVILGDASETYQAIAAEVRVELAGQPVQASFVSSNRLDDLITQLKQAEGRFIFLTTLGAVADAQGRTLPLKETLHAIVTSGDFVIFSMEDAYLQPGVLGGWVTCGTCQGRVAEQLIRQYLSGTPMDALGLIEASPNEYIFDDLELARVGLTLPPGVRREAKLVNEQLGFYETNRRMLLASLYALGGLLVLALIGTLILFVRKNRVILAASHRLTESDARFRTLFDSLPDPALLIDQCHIVESNQAAVAMFGYPSKKGLLGIHLGALGPSLQPDGEVTLDKAERMMAIARNTGINHYECRHKRADGSSFDAEITLSAISIQGNLAICGIVRDVTERKQTEARLQLMATVFSNSNEAIIVTDANNRIVAVNPAFTTLTGYLQDDVHGKNPSILSAGNTPKEVYDQMWASLNQTGQWQGELWDRRKTGESYPKWLSISVVRDSDGLVVNFIGSFVDISERKASEEKIRHLAHHDALTGLPNRFSLEERLEQGLLFSKRSGKQLGLMMIDLDRFKIINDTLGHHVGDELLIQVAKRLSQSVRESDIVARLGGDEFVVVLPNIATANDAAHIACKILNAVREPYPIDDKELRTSPSIGISLFPD
ncbi:MAG: diguanylate cyclase, partial [Gammaproteobacteria bacterium]|nr:diguanylate cyclase [Gammaproteobacteria bacterium]